MTPSRSRHTFHAKAAVELYAAVVQHRPDFTASLGLAAESRLYGGSGEGLTRRVAAALATLIGALTGALLQATSLFVALAVATSLAGFSALASPRAERASR